MGTLAKGLHGFEGAYVGSTEVKKIYQGNDLVWDGTIPYDAEIEFLEVNGSVSYIDTNFYLLAGDVIYCRAYTYANTDFYPFGCGGSNYSNVWGVFRTRTNWCGYWREGRGLQGEYQETSFNNWTIVRQSGSNYDLIRTYQSYPYGTSATSNAAKPLYLFAFNNNGTALISHDGSLTNHMKISELWIKRNQETVFDMIPVRKGNVGYMYDKVSRTLFGNSGVGSFILGTDVS